MRTVPQPQAPENPSPIFDLRPAQYVALRRWHDSRSISDVEQALAEQPFFPLIDGRASRPAN